MLAVISSDIKHSQLTFKPTQPKHSYEHPVNLYAILLDGEELGSIGNVHPEVGKKIYKKANVVFA